MKPTRQTQPYRDVRPPGDALDAMQRGRTAGGLNPQDAKRALAKKGKKKHKRSHGSLAAKLAALHGR